MAIAELRLLSEALQKADAEQVRNLAAQALPDRLSSGQILPEGLLATHEPGPLPVPVQDRLKDIVKKYPAG